MPSYMRCGCQNGRNTSGPIVVDTRGSIFNPPAGTRQRFCYQISAADEQGNVYAPMDYVVLGLGSGIDKNDLYAVTVSVNGVMQNVVWGQNAWFISCDSLDGAMGCAGLKLAFPLCHCSDVMGVCVTMKRVFTVGTINGCLYAGGNIIGFNGIPGPVQADEDNCPDTAYQEVEVCLPITIKPCAQVGEATITCCGDPVIKKNDDCCNGKEGGQCAFTVSQRVRVAFPVDSDANGESRDHSMSCCKSSEWGWDQRSINNTAAFAARQALENGMVQVHSNAVRYQSFKGSAMGRNDVDTDKCSCCQQGMRQTRIQDLLEDPMIWND